ncbi:E3 ubiquitin-protein ligase TRIM56 [Holothuria leucospilota]|uniref:E3 ubiquitin-protein ligase TRIM56 n=1 Tax=Holothuria leucospilota TaxID=206669 RepID=A0A9Q1BPH7_HOLLE|nr:E3 ubiquitin-protein ligase TRIM56 [Holothuria leucospilota]
MSTAHEEQARSKDSPRAAKDVDIVSKISSLTCCVCYEKISETKTLYCGHSLCNEPCLQTLFNKGNPKCPTCNEDVQLPPSGLTSDFPTNFGLGSVLRSYRNFLKSGSSTGVSSKEANDRLRTEHKPPSKRCGIINPFNRKDLCKTHERLFRFSCVTCNELDVCFICILKSHSEHEFHERDPADHDGAYLTSFARGIVGQERTLKKISKILDKTRDGYLKATTKTKEEIQMTAKRIHEKLTKEEKSLLEELDQLRESRKEYFKDLYLAHENMLAKEKTVINMIDSLGHSIELEGTFLGLKDIENAEIVLRDTENQIETLKQFCECKHPQLKFFPRPFGGALIGNLQKVCNEAEKKVVLGNLEGDLTTLHAERAEEMQTGRSCVSIIWLHDDIYAAIIDHTSKKGCVELSVYRLHEKGTECQTKQFFESAIDTVRVCNKVGLNGRGILLAVGHDIIVVTFGKEYEERPTSMRINVDFRIEAISWGIVSEEYFILSARPWQVVKVDTYGTCTHLTTLNSPCYGPFLLTVNYSFVVADIYQNIFIVNDATKVFPSRQVRGPLSIAKAWPAGISFNQETGDWFLLWKNVCSNVTLHVDWALTRHTSTFEYRGIIVSGAMSERDPRFVSSYKNKLAILFHGGIVTIYNTHRGNISP